MKILIADDDAAIRKSLILTLMNEDYELLEADNLETVYQKIVTEQPDLLLLDVHFKEATSLSLMKRLVSEQIQIPTVILSGAATAAEAAEAVKYGAYDYIEKPISAERLKLTLSRCLENYSLKKYIQGMAIQSNKSIPVIGKSEAIVKIRGQIDQYAKKNIKILITGETGSGKEVVAHAIWQASERSDRPYIIVNSAAVPETLVESELFGHKKGSFTGAVADQVGKIELADHGTLFLDEVGDLSLAAQTKLLRFLETGEIQKVGSNQIRKVDVRLIAATSRDLEDEMEKGRFRADLYYRLNVVRIEVPPLRERPEDISELFVHFLKSFSQKFGEAEKLISSEVLEMIESYPWPGNVREVRNIAERIAVLPGKYVMKEHLTSWIGNKSVRGKGAVVDSPILEALSLKEFKNQSEKKYIESVLEKSSGCITEAARMLKIDRTYLHQKMTHHSISKTQFRKA